ncbi:hypothetical protein HZS_1631, partial [Henneguya salminicola]
MTGKPLVIILAKPEIIEKSFQINFYDQYLNDSFNLDESFSSYPENLSEIHTEDIFSQLPKNTRELLSKYRGITKLFDWQEKILKLPCIYKGGNLIYTSPTGGGKTLVSELILMREVLTYRKNAIYVVPYVSLAHEKVSSLAPLGCSLGFHVEEYASSKGIIPPRKRYKRNSIYIATIEKGSLLINSLLEEDRIDSIGLIVVDEIHMINEPKRGVTLEIMLTKILHHKLSIQIIGMSATLKNVNDLCSFLSATYFSCTQRPVPPFMITLDCIDRKLIKRNKSKLDERIELIKSLEYVTGGVCNILRCCIPKGISYHHAGMADDERKIIEEAFLCGTIYILCCTSTLAAGVNLPAFRVIIKSPFIGIDELNNVNYRQMIGRAGRPGLSQSGESILMIENKDKKMLDKILSADNMCMSALSLITDIDLATIVLSLCNQNKSLEKKDIYKYFTNTLFHRQLQDNEKRLEFAKKIENSFDILFEKKLISYTENSPLIKLTNIGIGLTKRKSIWSISTDFNIPRGVLQFLSTSSISNASSLSRLITEMKEFWHIKLLLEEMTKKLSLINSLEVLPLLEISGVKQARAKQLYKAGYKTVSEVASAESENLITTIPHLSRRQAASIISSARLLIREQVEKLREEAEQILEKFNDTD